MSILAIQELTTLPERLRKWVPQCANPACARQPWQRVISRRMAGVAISDRWLCSPDCFQEAALLRIRDLLASRRKSDQAPSLRMPLGLLLLSREVLSPEQLKLALDQQRSTGASIGDVVQELGFATPEQVTAAVAAQWACPVFSLDGRALPTQIHIPRRLLEIYEMLPVHFAETGRKLLMGFVSRVQHHMLRTIEEMSSCVSTPCFITGRQYRQHLNAVILKTRNDEIVFDRVTPMAEMARVVRNYVDQAAAEEVRFGLCREYLWSRIRGRQIELDLLFRV